MRGLVVCAGALLFACSDAGATNGGMGAGASPSAGGNSSVGGMPSVGGNDAAGGGAPGGAAAGGAEPGFAVSTSVIGSQHRFIDGAMFGGWGPHLGHLVELPTGVFFVDDVCSQPGDVELAACDVNDDHTLGYYRREATGWSLVTTQALPGTVQQNTATIARADGSALETFGIDVAGGKLQQCTFSVATGQVACDELPFVLAPSSNYIGAALSPLGYRLVWWTTVSDGGGGSFHYIVDYGGGFNGPRSGSIIGYNDASYINIAFPQAPPARFVMHGQLVSGLAPDWTFVGAVGVADLTTVDPVVWSTPLVSVADADPIVSTNDLWIDEASDDEHLIARTAAGGAAYFHRAASGAWSESSFVLAQSFRARLVPYGDKLALVYGRSGAGLAFRVASAADRPAGQPIDWASLTEHVIELPEGYADLYAIYPASPPYQPAAGAQIELALVGAERQYEVLGVTLTQR